MPLQKTAAIYSNQYATPNPVNSIAIGTGAYASGNKTIAIGEEAGKGSLGWENVALGVKSGQNIKPMTVDMNGGTMLPFAPTWNPAAAGNVALGNGSGNNITGGGNLAVGTSAGNNVGPLTNPDPSMAMEEQEMARTIPLLARLPPTTYQALKILVLGSNLAAIPLATTTWQWGSWQATL